MDAWDGWNGSFDAPPLAKPLVDGWKELIWTWLGDWMDGWTGWCLLGELGSSTHGPTSWKGVGSIRIQVEWMLGLSIAVFGCGMVSSSRKMVEVVVGMSSGIQSSYLHHLER
jgi:hypothetical protein